MATDWAWNHLLTPRNGRGKFRTPVHSPSSVCAVMWQAEIADRLGRA
jgi:hypothetical protein